MLTLLLVDLVTAFCYISTASPLSEDENEAVAYTSGSTTIDEFNKQQSTSASVGYSPLQSSQSSAVTASGLRRGKTSVR